VEEEREGMREIRPEELVEIKGRDRKEGMKKREN